MTQKEVDCIRDCPPDLADGLAALGEADAELFIDFVRSAGLEKRPHRLGHALTVAAILRMAEWKAAGHGKHLSGYWPTKEEVHACVPARGAKHGGAVTSTGMLSPLSTRYFGAWIERFAWQGQRELGVDVLVNFSEASLSDCAGSLADVLLAAAPKLEGSHADTQSE